MDVTADEERKLKDQKCRVKDLEGQLLARQAAVEEKEGTVAAREKEVADRAQALASREKEVAEMQVSAGSEEFLSLWSVRELEGWGGVIQGPVTGGRTASTSADVLCDLHLCSSARSTTSNDIARRCHSVRIHSEMPPP